MRTATAPRTAWPLLLALLLLGASALPAAAAPPRPAAAAPAACRPPLADGFSRVFTHIENGLGSQRRMLQFATLGMCLALWILMRK
jgi:hypothetical protein